MKRAIPFLFLVAVLCVAGLLSIASRAQTTTYNYGTFNHAQHDTAITQSGQPKISCDTCHKREGASTQLYYPGHDACIQCHVKQFTEQSFDICKICHKDVKAAGRELMDFPAERKDYGVRFDGAAQRSQHVVHMNATLPDGSKVTCGFCHKAQGPNHGFPSHPECYACHSQGVNSPASKGALTDCATCHPGPNEPNSEMKRLVSTRRNDALPYRFRHIDHTRALGTTCVECHNYNTQAPQVHVVSSGTKEHRTRPNFNCYECHRGGGKSRIVETSCGSCHGVIVF